MRVNDKFEDENHEKVSIWLFLTDFIHCMISIIIYLQAWQREFNRSCYIYDVTNLILGIFMNLAGTLQLKKHSDPLHNKVPIFFSATVFCQQLCIFVLLVWHRQLFTRWRKHIVLSILLSRMLLIYFAMSDHPTFLRIWPLKMPDRAGKAALHVLFLPLMLSRYCLSFLLDENAATILCLSSVGVMAYSNYDRCTLELAHVPGQGHRYFDIINAIQNFLMEWLPGPSIFPFGTNIGVGSLTERGACIALKSTLQITMGYFLPMAVLLAEEFVSRKKFRVKYGLSNTLTHPPSIIILQYLCLIPFQAAVIFHATVLFLHWSGF